MARIISEPKRVQAHGSPPKVIEEFIGRADSEGAVSIARMASPAGWSEPGQTPEFDEYTVVLRGTLHVQTREGSHTVGGGQAILVRRGEWVRYSTPEVGGAEYIAVCLPGFSPEIVHRDAEQSSPDTTAVRVALWRALHVQVDPPPHVLEDEIGLRLAAPDEGWRLRPDMDARATSLFRASIVARARFIEDLVVERAGRGLGQYVILGAGLDTFAQRRPEIASRLLVFEVDQPGPQAWKRRRLTELGFGVPEWLRLVPVDFEAGGSWRNGLVAAGFDDSKPAVVVSTGVSMYLTRDANAATLRQVAALAPGSTLAMTFLLPLELADPEVRPGLERAVKGARASGTPFISFFTPAEMLTLAREAGFRDVQHVSAATLTERYFAGRTDGLRPPTNTEELLLATA